MMRINRKVAAVALVAIASIVALAAGTYVGVQAYSGTYFGRKQGYGYFENEKHSADGNGYVLSRGIKKDSVSSFIKYLKDKNDDEDSQDGTGAAFIVYTMLGKSGKDRDKDISGGDWDELEKRLRSLDGSGRIDWSVTVSLSKNSYHQKWTVKKTSKKGKVTTETHHDDAFYSRSDPEKSIAFYDDKGKVVYALAHKCANPMGNIDAGIPEPNKWSVSVKSEVSKKKTTPGDTIEWKHTIENKGPDSTDVDVKYRYENNGALGGGNGSDHTFDHGAKKGEDEDFKSTHRITQDDVGDNLCRSTSAKPKAWDSSSRVESSDACVYIPYNYRLTPFISSSISGTVEAGTAFTVSPSVTNAGPTISRNTNWRITEIVVNPGAAVPDAAGGTSPQAPCPTYFTSANSNCSIIAQGTTAFSESGAYRSGSAVGATSVTAGDYEVGTKICYAFSVQPRASSVPSNPGSDDQWAHSAPVCMIVGKKPKVQIWGGDLSAGGMIRTSLAVKNIGGASRTFGSWGEYGLFSTGAVLGMGSGAAFAGPGLANSTVCNYSTLSFTNAGTVICTPTTEIGRYTKMQSAPDVSASFPVDISDPTRNLGSNPTIDLSTLSGIYRASGNIRINGGGAGKVIGKGKWVVINAPSANVTITDNIRYTDEVLNSVGDIPQVVIIASNINIADGVDNVDAWLVATANINTCESVGTNAPLSSNLCNRRLTINGPAIANKLYLRRTAGSGVGAASGDPAEVFNLRADAYLWSIARSYGTSRIQTVYTAELPPRF